ncbi:MAG: D-alanyl-D-alanine carboxypeptidase/D-alanyl-D-alanine-endopeptidase [Candidatus Endonucleobacter sp. (ex Gigantidas childressi)]|nr:D-alanyl-D-alanine carboxypeptidase/D-alanyl-D-alanine-endopeptidase [Candidatus Endonucleobacter sp. (ex Gigantidas childressi)]
MAVDVLGEIITVRKMLSVICCVLISSTYAEEKLTHSVALSQQSALVKELDAHIATLLPSIVSSIIVSNATDGHVIYERNSLLNLVPASVLKTLTAMVAFDALGGGFRYTTRVVSKRNEYVKKKRSIEEMAIIFEGDPSLQREYLKALLLSVRKKGIQEIRGKVWLDGSAFSGYPKADGVSWNDLKICFGAPSTAMILDRNCFYALLSPNKTPGKKALVDYMHPERPMRLDNRLITVNADHEEACQPRSWPSKKANYQLEGCMTLYDTPISLAFAVNNPEQEMKTFVMASLKDLGIKHRGRVVIGKPDSNLSEVLGEHSSEPLSELLITMLKTSDNLYADSFLKTIGYKYSGKSGSYQTGINALIAGLEKAKIDLRCSHFEDGSGLSRDNLMSAATLNDILLFSWRKGKEQLPWLASREQEDRWFKTGTMKGVRSVCGYAFPENSPPLVFVVLLNGVVPRNGVSEAEAISFIQNIQLFQRRFIDVIANKKNKY